MQMAIGHFRASDVDLMCTNIGFESDYNPIIPVCRLDPIFDGETSEKRVRRRLGCTDLFNFRVLMNDNRLLRVCRCSQTTSKRHGAGVNCGSDLFSGLSCGSYNGITANSIMPVWLPIRPPHFFFFLSLTEHDRTNGPFSHPSDVN